MNPAAIAVWHAPRYLEFAFRHWQGSTFVFDPASGRTHYLNDAAAEILDRLAEAPSSAGALLETMLADHPADDPQAFREAAQRVITLLDQLGLIREVA